MRIRPSWSLWVFLAPGLISAQLEQPASPTDKSGLVSQESKDVLTNEDILALNHPPAGAADALSSSSRTKAAVLADATSTSAAATSSTTSTKRYVGTEDAPVDGLDGKPHAGPFVDTTPDDLKSTTTTGAGKSTPTSLKNFEASSENGWKIADIPEKNDGVMNDDNRQVPKKGTTGTEGGISEKEKTKGKQAKIGEEREPQQPKEQRPLPHSEEQHIEAAGEERTKATKVEKEGVKDAVTGKTLESSEKKAGEYGDGGHLLEKPTDLPEKPHNIPHPEPNIPSSEKTDGPPVTLDKETSGSSPKTSKPPRPADVSSHDAMDWHEWIHSFVLSFTMIIFSEIGDKTFLVAALMAMRHARWVVFSAALSALIAMTVLSAVLGHAFPTLLPRKLTTFAAAILFFVFGAKSLREGLAMPRSAGVGEEMKEVEAELEEKEHDLARRASYANTSSLSALESARGRSPPPSRSFSPAKSRDRPAGLTNLLSLLLSPAWVQTFVMTFLGEWGDRSQIATIAMAAGQDYWWVTLGAILGHACCTGIAVLGGRALAGRVSMRVVTIGGAAAFLVFGVIYLYECLVE